MNATVICNIHDAEIVFCKKRHFKNYNEIKEFVDDVMSKKYLLPVFDEDGKNVGFVQVKDACVVSTVEEEKRKPKHGRR